ncbi:hypothetical protein YC2023_083250 [Brassica napus]
MPYTSPYHILGPDEESGTLGFSIYKVLSELFEPRRIIGAAHGWAAPLKNGISMPPLVHLPGCQTQVVTNVSMSSSSP